MLFLSRTSKPQISYVVGFLGRFVSSWQRYHDRVLLRLIEYLAISAGDALTLTINTDDLYTVTADLFCGR